MNRQICDGSLIADKASAVRPELILRPFVGPLMAEVAVKRLA